jgi:hypothetical protein
MEAKTEKENWQSAPIRMLRYKVLVQCARLAFGISMPLPQKEKIKSNLLIHQTQNKNRAKPTESQSMRLKKRLQIDRITKKSFEETSTSP